MSTRCTLLMSALALLVACERDRYEPEPEGMAPASREQTEAERQARTQRQAEQQASPMGAANQLAAARCEREQRCNNIGADRRYSSTADCINRVGTDWSEDLNARSCPEGVVQKEFDECLEEIRNEDCNAPFDSLGRIAACRASDICNAAP